MQTTVIWLSLFVLFLVIEIITMGLTTIWFAGGALVAFLVAVLGLGLGVQIIIFAIVSLALLAVTRPLAMKYFNQERQKTGAELLIGQKALVIEEIDTLSSKGRVEVRGQLMNFLLNVRLIECLYQTVTQLLSSSHSRTA